MKVPLYFAFILLLLFSCKNEVPKNPSSEEELHIAITRDPNKLNPLVYPVQRAREVYQYIFLSLADFNPTTLELEPILIKNIPEGVEVNKGLDAGRTRFDIEFREDARWDNGTPITGEDYLFTLKTIKHPETATASYRSYLSHLVDARLDPTNNRKVSVFFDEYYMLSKEIVSTLEVYPKYFYDPKGSLDNVPLSVFNSSELIKEVANKDSNFVAFAKEFNSVKYAREKVSGPGPYQLLDWVTDQIVVLERKEDYWGSNLSNPYLQAGPKRIVFHIIPDELNVVNQLKSGEIDLYPSATSKAFLSLKENEVYQEKLTFLTAELMRFYFIAINNSSPALADKDIRRAMAHLVDVDEIIELMEGGLAKKASSIFNIRKEYYHNELQPINKDISKAKTILQKEGWSDTNNNGVIDKVINGTLEELELDMYTTSSDLSNKIALLLSQNAQDVGVKINIIQKKYSDFKRENLPKRDYDLITSAITQDATLDDPYAKWHSINDTPTGSNTVSYHSDEADKIIEAIRETKSSEERKKHYLELQEVMHKDQPVIFLYHPLEKIIISKEWNGSASPKRPGYFANTFTYKG